MRNPEDVRAMLRRRAESSLAAWLANPDNAALSFPLHPPTAATALAEPGEVSAWMDSWRSAPAPLREGACWEERRWAQLGAQRVPVRWEGTGADLLAQCAGAATARSWQVLSALVEAAVASLGTAEPEAMAAPSAETAAEIAGGAVSQDPSRLRTAVAAAVAGLRARWLELSPLDADLTIRAATWFLVHPGSGLRIRQVPLPGMHTKWLRVHRALVERLVSAAREDGSEDLGLAAAPQFHDLLVLDQTLHGGLPRVSRVDLETLPSLELAPDVVVICENSETVQVLPDLPGAVALSGAGYSVPALLTVPWIAAAPVLYWGDLDADGFRILDRARHHHPRVRSVLMDHATLERHRELVVDGGARPETDHTQLTTAEQTLHRMLSASGERLEQERIELGFAVTALRRALRET
ncbi:hypothetical protein CIK66_02650 [Brachybacterium alimentarium]|uniref:DUF3322 and DUF2220 domain-containing protein n=1 Tax=Brachybacterium alimentarium TaxID=47845 RepID=A0A2A3YN11_9MICO|nr:Wadjet anti-phage system protein JetD domain-containing protein [Brachybacterium alimentarium]PCC40684.1 hypothetical protein CIK66_02650 [Brachybacterium alimentarium]